MITLYQFAVCPFCLKVRKVLDFKGLDYQIVEVNPMNKKELKEVTDYKKVPVLKDGDQLITDSNNIIRYLDQKYPDKSVYAKSSTQKEEQQKWLDFVDKELVILLPPNIYRNFKEARQSFGYITKQTKFSPIKRAFIRNAGALAMTIVAKKKTKEYKIDDPRKTLAAKLGKWADELQDKPFRGGDQPDVTDLACAGVLDSVKSLPVWEFISQNPKIGAWHKRVEGKANLKK